MSEKSHQPRHYRIRLLNGSDSRFYVFRLRQAASTTSDTLAGAGDPLPFYQVGADDGLLPHPVSLNQLILAPGERADLVLDFTPYPGLRLILDNIGPDSPFGGLDIDPADYFGDPGNAVFPNATRHTDRIMAFDVAANASADPDHFAMRLASVGSINQFGTGHH